MSALFRVLKLCLAGADSKNTLANEDQRIRRYSCCGVGGDGRPGGLGEA